jgi:hypothetical protein
MDPALHSETKASVPKPDENPRQQVVFDLSEWVRAKLAMKNFTVNLDQLSLPVFDFSRPYAWHLSVYVPVVYSIVGLGYFLSFCELNFPPCMHICDSMVHPAGWAKPFIIAEIMISQRNHLSAST